MFILFGTIAVLIISVLQILVFEKKKSFGKCLHIFLKNEFVVNLVSLALLTYVFKYQHIFVTKGYGVTSFIKYFLLAVVVGICFMLLCQIFEGRIVFKSSEVKKSRGAKAVRIISPILVCLGSAMYFATIWSRKAFGEISGDQLLINLLSPTTGTDVTVYEECFEGPVFQTMLVTAIFCLFVFSKFTASYVNLGKAKCVFNDLWRRIISLVLSLAVLVGGAFYCYNGLKLRDVYLSYFAKSDMIETTYADPREVKITFPEKKRNLIHIYLESMENSFLSTDLGGYMDTNLMPELTELSYEGVVFSHNDSKFGGPQQATGTQWSIASMVNQCTGLPMKTPDGPNSYGSKDNFLPGACTLYDLLKEQGYEQTAMFGADAQFGGLRYLFEAHGDVKVFDIKYARENGYVPKDYNVWWGYEDDKLYEFAKEEITRLYETGKPFNFTMETADTHRPNGYLSPNAPTPYDKQYANVIAYSSSEAVKLIRWIQEQPFYDNTTIVVIGDHLSMDTEFFEDFDKKYFRNQYNLILNPVQGADSVSESVCRNRQYANFDMFPTILSSMGVQIEGNRLGVGTDLFSGDKTIIEEYGLDTVNLELQKKSDYYNAKILNGNTVPRSHRTKNQWAEYDAKNATSTTKPSKAADASTTSKPHGKTVSHPSTTLHETTVKGN